MKTATHRAPSPIATIVAALAAAVTLAACAGPHVELTSQRPALDDDSPLPSAIETHTCYVGVGPDASDAHVDPYDRAAPFATVAAALARGRADCGVIVLLDGTYAQRIVIIGNRPAPGEGWLTITADHPFHDLTAPAGDSSTGPPGSAWPTGAVIDGGLAPVDGRLARQAAVAIYDSSYVRIDGLRVRDDANKYCTAYPPSSSQCNNAGIDVRDVPGGSGPSSHHVEIRGNEISGVVAARLATGGTLAAPTACTGDPRACTRKYDSTSLAVYAGRGDAAGATHHVALVDNVVHDCDPNSDHNGVPLVLVSTNVEDVLVQGNAILGGLASAALPGYPGLTVRGERFGVSADPTLDRARRVVIRRNLFAELGGPAVSVQSANNVLVERNVASATGYGFQVTTEGDQAHGTGPQEVTWAHQIWIRANLVVDADVWAIDAGQVSSGYSYVHDVYVTNNTIVASEHLRPSPVGARDAMVFREGVTGDSVFANNLVYLGLAGDEGCQWDSAYTGCDYAALVYRGVRDNAMLVDDNLWAAPPAPSPPPLFCLQPPAGAWTCTTFRGFQDAGFDAHGRFADPVFGSAGFVPSPTSPAIDGGVVVTPSWLADGGANFGDYVAAYDDEPASFPERDHAGVLRTPSWSGAIDVGMYEVSP